MFLVFNELFHFFPVLFTKHMILMYTGVCDFAYELLSVHVQFFKVVLKINKL